MEMIAQKEGCSNKPSVLVVGTGAIGGFYGGKLSQAGARVALVSRSDYGVVKGRGIRVQSIMGDFTYRPDEVLRNAGEYGAHPDYILVALKGVPGVDTPELIRAAVGPRTSIVLVQNGIDIEAPVVQAFPDNEIISGIAFIAVCRTAPGMILHQDFGRLTLGVYPSGTSEQAQRLCECFRSAGVPCEVSPDVVTARWQKLVWNAAFNPLSVLSGGADTHEILASEETLKLARRIMEEVCLIAKATGHELPLAVIDQAVQGTLAMKPYKTSMLQDYEARKPLEVESILGNAVRLSRRTRTRTPCLESIYALLLLADKKNRHKG